MADKEIPKLVNSKAKDIGIGFLPGQGLIVEVWSETKTDIVTVDTLIWRTEG